MGNKGKRVELLDALQVERARYVELRSKKSGALLGNRLADGAGLYLFITPNNAKSWRFDYRFAGERRVWVYGSYPDLSLKDARTRHQKLRLMLADGIDPAKVRREKEEQDRKEIEKKNAASKNSFQWMGEDWYKTELHHAAVKEKKPLSQSWQENTRRWLNLAYKEFGNKPLHEITAQDVKALVKKVERKGYAASAEYLRQTVSRVFAYAIREHDATAGYNPAEALQGIVRVPKKNHHPKLNPDEIPAFIAAVKNSSEPEDVKLGLLILLHTFPRRAELIFTPWSEIDGDLWTIPQERMKKDREHVIPLSTQVRGMFDRLRELSKGSPWVFASPQDPRKPRCKQTFNLALYRIGYKGIFSPHGTRSTAASIIADRGVDKGFTEDVIEAALAHGKDGNTEKAYFRNTYLAKRTEVMAWWSGYLENAERGAKIIPITAGAAA